MAVLDSAEFVFHSAREARYHDDTKEFFLIAIISASGLVGGAVHAQNKPYMKEGKSVSLRQLLGGSFMNHQAQGIRSKGASPLH